MPVAKRLFSVDSMHHREHLHFVLYSLRICAGPALGHTCSQIRAFPNPVPN